MRIVSGKFRGAAIAAPKGRATRPTSDKARQAAFNILEHAEWAPPLEGARVIDLFAGAGALGFEAMSRGAAFCLFVETEAAARGAIRETAEALGLMGATRIHRRSAVDLGAKPAGVGARFTLAFLDPPYGQDLGPPALAGLKRGAWLADDALAVLEVGAREQPVIEGFDVLDTREYGAAKMIFLKPNADAS
jgi:16S rRNA (guanine966-N2)-methyltransferase